LRNALRDIAMRADGDGEQFKKGLFEEEYDNVMNLSEIHLTLAPIRRDLEEAGRAPIDPKDLKEIRYVSTHMLLACSYHGCSPTFCILAVTAFRMRKRVAC
jgi:hypothetical protein